MSSYLSPGAYVPVHRRGSSSSSSSSRPTSVPHPYIYTPEALLALAPPSHVHGTDALPSPPSSPSAFEHSSTSSEPHKGWTNLNAAMRTYLRAACPEIAMNRKMRKSLEFHQRATRQDEGRKSRDVSRQRSGSPHTSSPQTPRSPLGPATASLPEQESSPVPFKLAPAPQRQVPTASEALKRARSPTPRRIRPTNSRTRHANFTQMHFNAAALASATEGNWRTVARRGVALPTVSVA